MTDVDQMQRLRQRLRVFLAVTIVLLVLLLIGLSVIIAQVVSPDSRPESDDTADGIEWIRSIYGYGPSKDEQLAAPNDAGIAPDGTIWVTDGQRSRILAFAPDGTYLRQIYAGGESVEAGGLYRPDAIDFNEAGDIFIADYGTQRITVWTQDSEFVREWPIQAPLEVAVRDGRVVVGTRYGVGVFTEEGELITQFGQLGKGPEDFDGVRGVAMAEDGTMYFADTHNARVKAYSPEGALLWVSPPEAETASDESQVGTQTAQQEEGEFPVLQLPVGLTVDGTGRLVVLDAFDFQMVVLDPASEGKLVGRYGNFGAEDGSFHYPTGIDYDPQRDWFAVADTSNDRAQVVRIPDSGGGILAVARRAWTTPLKLCAVPLVLLLIAVIIGVARFRKRNMASEQGVSA